VLREGESVRICLDARRVNKHMIADRIRIQPIGELLQQFHWCKFISTIDLASTFLQLELHPDSREYLFLKDRYSNTLAFHLDFVTRCPRLLEH
jgi:hypothetical protein